MTSPSAAAAPDGPCSHKEVSLHFQQLLTPSAFTLVIHSLPQESCQISSIKLAHSLKSDSTDTSGMRLSLIPKYSSAHSALCCTRSHSINNWPSTTTWNLALCIQTWTSQTGPPPSQITQEMTIQSQMRYTATSEDTLLQLQLQLITHLRGAQSAAHTMPDVIYSSSKY